MTAAPNAGHGNSTGDEIDVLALLLRCWRRRWLAAVVTLLCIGAAAVLGLRRPPVFVATAELIAASGPAGYTATSPESVPGVVSDLWSGARARSNLTHAEAMRSPRMLRNAFDQLPPDLRDAFPGCGDDPARLPVRVTAPLNTDVISVTVTSRSREASLALADALTGVYTTYTQRMSVSMAQEGASALAPEAETTLSAMKAAESELLSRQRESTIYDPASMLAAATTRTDDFRSQLSAAQIRLATVSRELEVARHLRDSVPARIATCETSERGRMTDELERKLAALRSDLARDGAVYRDDSPRLGVLKDSEEALSGDLAERPETVPSAKETDVNPTWLSLDEKAAELEREQEGLRAEANATRAELASHNTWLERVAEEESVQSRLQSIVSAQRDAYAMMTRQLGLLRAGAAARLPTVSPLGPATAPKAGTRQPVPILATGLLSGILTSLVLITVLEIRASSRAKGLPPTAPSEL